MQRQYQTDIHPHPAQDRWKRASHVTQAANFEEWIRLCGKEEHSKG